MATRMLCSFLLIQVATLLLCSGAKLKEPTLLNQQSIKEEKKVQVSMTISNGQRDVTTPITTIPTINPTSPLLDPTVSNPDSTATNPLANPVMTPITTSPVSPGSSWCVASQSASQIALQVALDYACGYGGADCKAIQPGESCYYPNTLRDHASYAFNSYYLNNPIPNSCNFGGSAITTNTDPSSSSCRYPSTSMSGSVLNTTNSSGSRVFGAGPRTPGSSSAATRPTTSRHLHVYGILLISIEILLIIHIQ